MRKAVGTAGSLMSPLGWIMHSTLSSQQLPRDPSSCAKMLNAFHVNARSKLLLPRDAVSAVFSVALRVRLSVRHKAGFYQTRAIDSIRASMGSSG